jgi:hypothetical protein
MADGEDWLLRPVVRKLCRFESLTNGALDLADIGLMNEALDVEDENQRRWHDANK